MAVRRKAGVKPTMKMTTSKVRTGLCSVAAFLAAIGAGLPSASAHGGRFGPPVPIPFPLGPPTLGPTQPAPPGPPPTTPPGGGFTPPGPGTGLTGIEPMGGPRRSGTGTPLKTGGWRDWWEANGAALVGRRPVRTRVTTDSPLFRVGGGENGNRSDAERPTQRALEDWILPTLRFAIDAKNHFDPDTVSSGCLALGKTARGEDDVRLLLDACRRRSTSELAHDGAILSLGLLRRTPAALRFDPRILDEARAALFATMDDDTLPPRSRCFAALAIGLLGDQDASSGDLPSKAGTAVVRGLWMRLDDKHVGEDLPVALCVALSLQPPQAIPTGVLEGLRSIAVTGLLKGRRFGPLARAQALLALARLSDSTGAGVFLGVLRGHSGELPIRRAAIVSLGIAASRLEAGARREAALSLADAYEHGDDPDTMGLLLISLARLLAADGLEGSSALLDGTGADETLVRAARQGRAEVRPFGALALGIACHGIEVSADTGSFPAFRVRAIDALREGASEDHLDPMSRGAYCIGLGLLGDEGATKILSAIAGKSSAPDELRGFACAALGLVGRVTPEVVQTLKAALKEHSSDELRRQAAAGLGMLGDVSAVPILVADLEAGGSDHVLAQVVLGLGAIGDVRAVDPLAKIVKGKATSDLVRALACAGLGLVGDLEPFASLSRLGSDSNYLTPIDALTEALSLL